MDTTSTSAGSKSVFKTMSLFLFFILAVSWFILQFYFKSTLSSYNLYWAASYQILALLGAIGGFFVFRSWGGSKSLIGKCIMFFSIGLLFQVLGQSVFSFYTTILKVEIPYPSLGDIGFFGSTICYIIAGWLLVRANGIHISFQSYKGKIFSIITPIILLLISYQFFLKGYEFDWVSPVKVFLDFGYPLGDTLYVSLAVLALFLCQKFMGGLMKKPILFLIFALIFQYVADFNFLYQANHGTWINGGYGDLLYSISYLIIGLALLKFGEVFEKIKSAE